MASRPQTISGFFGFLPAGALELIAQRKLHNSRRARKAPEPAETCFPIEIEIDTGVAGWIYPSIKVHGVCQVEHFPAELDLSTLGHSETFLDTAIQGKETGTVKDIAVAGESGSRMLE